jgi:hypothetical protein
MAAITVAHRLPFVAVTLHANQQTLHLSRVLLDTGSAGTVFKTEDLEKIGVIFEDHDRIRYMTGIGGSELVVEKQIAKIEVGELVANPFLIQLGDLNYGLAMDGILGVDFLFQTGARIDFQKMVIEK